MLIVHKKKFFQGAILFLSFAALFWTMTLPLFHDSAGAKLNSLEYADTIFNELSKGSSWFIPDVQKAISELGEKNVNLSARIANADYRRIALMELERAEIADRREEGDIIHFSGNLAPLLSLATENSASLYNNDGAAVSARYEGAAPLQVSAAWWRLLNPCIKELQKRGEVAAAKVVEMVVKKAVEPGNNFYGLPTARVSENIILVCAMLAFYVLYAIWYGFAIYHLFDGFGLLGEEECVENVEESEV